jgi:hypothetical protein
MGYIIDWGAHCRPGMFESPGGLSREVAVTQLLNWHLAAMHTHMEAIEKMVADIAQWGQE